MATLKKLLENKEIDVGYGDIGEEVGFNKKSYVYCIAYTIFNMLCDEDGSWDNSRLPRTSDLKDVIFKSDLPRRIRRLDISYISAEFLPELEYVKSLIYEKHIAEFDAVLLPNGDVNRLFNEDPTSEHDEDYYEFLNYGLEDTAAQYSYIYTIYKYTSARGEDMLAVEYDMEAINKFLAFGKAVLLRDTADMSPKDFDDNWFDFFEHWKSFLGKECNIKRYSPWWEWKKDSHILVNENGKTVEIPSINKSLLYDRIVEAHLKESKSPIMLNLDPMYLAIPGAGRAWRVKSEIIEEVWSRG